MTPSELFRCLAEPTRLTMLFMLTEHDELCVCEITEAVEESQPKVSRHLAELRAAELVTDERRGRWVYYSLSPGLPDWILDVLRAAKPGASETLAPVLKKLEKAAISEEACA